MYTTAQRVVVDIPLDKPDGDERVSEAQDVGVVDLYVRSEQTVSFWGRRALLNARSLDSTRGVRLVLGVSDRAVVPFRAQTAISAGRTSGGTADLIPVREWVKAEQFRLSPEESRTVQQSLPTTTRRPHDVLARAGVLIQRLRDDFSGEWDTFRSWFVDGQWSPELKEAVIKTALGRLQPSQRPQIAALAESVLQGHHPVDPDYCLVLLPYLTSLSRGDFNIDYAKRLLALAREAAPQDPEITIDLDLFSARIMGAGGDRMGAVDGFLEAGDSVEFTADDALCLFCFADDLDGSTQERVITKLSKAAETNSEVMDFHRDAIRTWGTEDQRRDFLCRAVAQLIDDGRESDAVRECEAWWFDDTLRPNSMLDVLSEFEGAERADTVRELYRLLEFPAEQALRTVNPTLVANALSQIAPVETALGESDWTQSLRDRVEKLKPGAVDDVRPLDQVSVAFIGGRPRQTRILVDRAKEQGAVAEHIAAKWEKHNSKASMKPVARRNRYVVILTDEISHSDEDALDAALSGTQCQKLRLSGGPSRVLREFTDIIGSGRN